MSLRRFASLVTAISQTNASSRKVRLIADHLRNSDDAVAAWTVWFLQGRRFRRAIPGRTLRRWAAERAGISEQLAETCHDHVGDLAETLTLLSAPSDARPPEAAEDPALDEVARFSLAPLAEAEPELRRSMVESMWVRLDDESRFAFHKMLTGAFRLGVAGGLVEQAIAETLGVEVELLRERLAGGFEPDADSWRRLARPPTETERADRPLPFQLAHALETVDEIGPIDDWLIEPKWDGVRAQLIRRGEPALFGRGEGRLDGAFPEPIAAAAALPSGTVLDGEILLVDRDSGVPRPFAALQRRLGTVRTQANLFDTELAVFVAFDLLEVDGEDVRRRPLRERRTRLEALGLDEGGSAAIRISPRITTASWAQANGLRTEARSRGVEGLMIKRLDAVYAGGRPRGSWWKWKTDPRTIDAVLVHTQGGHGRRAGLLTDHTMALWDGDELVPVTRAYSGLTDAEMVELDRRLKRTIVGRKGPVRLLEPSIVLEIAFEGVQASTRHRSGIALRFPRIARWRRDKSPAEADHLEALRRLLPPEDRRTDPPDRASRPRSSP